MKTVIAAAAALCVVCVVATPQPRRETFRYWKKRMDSQPIVDQSSPNFQSPPPQFHGVNSQLVMRTPRGQRPYDIPQIECPPAPDGMERFACPSPDRQGRYHCIDDHVLCDGFTDCPNEEDEDRRSCMFYKTIADCLKEYVLKGLNMVLILHSGIKSTYYLPYQEASAINTIMNSIWFHTSAMYRTKAHLDVLADALLRWARGR